MSVKTDNGVEFLLEQAKATGVACSTVKDGHVLVFTRKHLQHILSSMNDQNEVIVFVKRPDFEKSS